MVINLQNKEELRTALTEQLNKSIYSFKVSYQYKNITLNLDEENVYFKDDIYSKSKLTINQIVDCIDSSSKYNRYYRFCKICGNRSEKKHHNNFKEIDVDTGCKICGESETSFILCS